MHHDSRETANGNFESRRLTIKSLHEFSVSNPSLKRTQFCKPGTRCGIHHFRNACALSNPNASRFGKYIKLQSTDRRRLCGIKTLVYYLAERNKVAAVSSVNATSTYSNSSPEGHHLHLQEKVWRRYVGQRSRTTRPNSVRDDDAHRFEQLKAALKSIGLKGTRFPDVSTHVHAILHLGNLGFTINCSRDAAVVRNTDILTPVADFLDV